MKGEYGKYQFLFLYSVFLLFVTFVGLWANMTLIKNAPEVPRLKLPEYPKFVSADELNNQTGTNCFYENKVLFTPWVTEIGKRNTWKYCSPECIVVTPECYEPGKCSQPGQSSCLITSEASYTMFGSPLGAYFGFAWDSITYFVKLMTVSTEFVIIEVLLIIPFLIILTLIIIELIQGFIPG